MVVIYCAADTLEVITSDNGTEGKEALDECETCWRNWTNLIELKSIYKHLQIHLQKKSRLKSGDFSTVNGL